MHVGVWQQKGAEITVRVAVEDELIPDGIDAEGQLAAARGAVRLQRCLLVTPAIPAVYP